MSSRAEAIRSERARVGRAGRCASFESGGSKVSDQEKEDAVRTGEEGLIDATAMWKDVMADGTDLSR